MQLIIRKSECKPGTWRSSLTGHEKNCVVVKKAVRAAAAPQIKGVTRRDERALGQIRNSN